MNADSTILVGVSGSPASLAALQWAEDEAERSQCRLRIVLICEDQQRASYAQQPPPSDGTDRVAKAQCVLTETVRGVLGSGPWHNTTVEAVEGRAEQALVAASERADLLVLGSGSTPVIGPVVRTCLTAAHCPVVVVGRVAEPNSAFSGLENEKQLADEPAVHHAYGRAPVPVGAVLAPR
jgi:nucleotide-binding universal stress UspA family protein